MLTPPVAASRHDESRIAAPMAGVAVGVTAAAATLHRRLPTTSFGPVQRLWVPAVAGALAFGAGTAAAAGLGAASRATGADPDALDAIAGAGGVAAYALLGRGAVGRSNLGSFARLAGGLVGAAAIADAGVRHGSAAIERTAGLDSGHADLAALGLVAGGGALAASIATHRLAAVNATFTGERAFGLPVGERVAAEQVPAVTPLPTVSLGADSAIPQDTIRKLGRQFLEGAVPAREIEAATGMPSVDPARVFVDLKSAPDAQGRIELLRREVERLGLVGGANQRSTIVMVSPAGAVTDLVATDTRELLERGDVAHLAVAFSDRPALQSINRVAGGVDQFREAVRTVRSMIDELPAAQRPRLEVYGESIGGIVGEQAVLKDGIATLDQLGVDRAVFVGSPSAGRAKRALLAAQERAGASDAIRYAGLDDALARHGAEAMRSARVQFLEHPEDAIASVRPRRIWQPTPIPAGSVVRNQAAHVPFATFGQMLGDAVNFKQPLGRLGARGHNYGADLPGVLRQLHPELDDSQMRGVVDVVRRKAAERARLVDVPELPPGFTAGDAP